MIKRFSKLAIFSMTAFAGIFAATVFSSDYFHFDLKTDRKATVRNPEISKSVRDLRLEFIGITAKSGKPEIEFRLTNNSSESLKYWSYEQKSLSLPVFEINGKQIELFYCGTGLIEFDFARGETIETNVPLDYLGNADSSDVESVKFGFVFTSKPGGVITIWSDEFRLSPGLRKKLGKPSMNSGLIRPTVKKAILLTE